jgi:putative aminopeptidase FrvX
MQKTSESRLGLLKSLCEVSSPSGSEFLMKAFLLQYLEQNKASWKCQPTVIDNQDTQDGMIWLFGNAPKTAVFAHQDTIGFTSRYDNRLVPIGSPNVEVGYALKSVTEPPVFAKLVAMEQDYLSLDLSHPVDAGTEWVFAPNFNETDAEITSPYLDNRMGLYVALKLAETLENGALVFSCYEEHKGGNVASIARVLYEKYNIHQALIADITWHTEGVFMGEGPAISLRDSYIPRKSFLNKVLQLADTSGIAFQKEVESSGGSDGSELQRSPYPFDWCFIGVPIKDAHTPEEKLSKLDLDSLVDLYKYLLERL